MSFMIELYQNPFLLWSLLVPLIFWSLIWKGVGLWSAAKNKQKWWFFFLFVFNTAGILPIIYLIWFRKKKE